MPKVTEMEMRIPGKKPIPLYRDRKVRKEPVKVKLEQAPKEFKLQYTARTYLKHGESSFARDFACSLDVGTADIDKTEDGFVYCTIPKEAFYDTVLRIVGSAEKSFYVSEEELLQRCQTYIQERFGDTVFTTQQRLGRRIIDGLAGIDRANGKRLIGFEVKTDQDTYERVGDQVLSYAAYIDYLYLVVDSHQVPVSLPKRVGVLSLGEDGLETVRPAKRLQRREFDEPKPDYVAEVFERFNRVTTWNTAFPSKKQRYDHEIHAMIDALETKQITLKNT